MATMWYKNVNCAVVYVDPGATGANTGATPTDAKTALPSPSAMAGGTVYLLRRGPTATPKTYTLQQTTNNNDSVAVWGMPLSTDEQYAMVPAEAKTAWDADTATMPVLQTISQTVSAVFAGFGFSVHRVNIRLGYDGSGHSSVPAIDFTGDCASMTHVKAQSTGFDLSSASSVTGSVGNTSFRFSGMTARVVDCEIQMPGQLDVNGVWNPLMANAYGILYHNSDGTIFIDNCVFRAGVLSCSYNSSGPSCIGITARMCKISNCSFDLVDYLTAQSQQGWRTPIKVCAKILRITNIAITTRALPGQTPVALNANYTVDPNVNISGIGQPPMPMIATVSFFDSSFAGDDGTYAADWVIDTVTIDASGLRYAPSGLNIGSFDSGDGSTMMGVRQINVRNITFNAPQALRINDNTVGLYVATGPGVYVENCAINYAATMAFAYVIGAGGGGGRTPYLSGKAALRNCTGKGRLRLDSVRYADIPTFTVVATDIVDPIEVYGGICYIGTLTMPAGWGATSMMSSAANAQLLVNSINIAAIVNLAKWTVVTYGVQHTITISNNGAAGAWAMWHSWQYVKSSTIYRTGGAAAALYVRTNTLSYSQRYCGPYLSQFPFASKVIAPGATGLRRVTVYVAFKGIAVDVVYRSVLVEVESPNGASGTRMHNSLAGGRIEIDASTWVNDTGLSIYRIVTLVNVDRLENLGVRVSFLPFASTTAYIYVDPKIVVSA